MNALSKMPTHIDYAHRMAEVAAEMAGYQLDDLRAWDTPSDQARNDLYMSFVRKGFAAVEVLGPAIVRLDTDEGEKLPAEVRQEGAERGYHPLATVRNWRGLSIEDLAAASGISPDLVRAIEAREVTANEMHDTAMAKVLRVSPHALADYGSIPEMDRHEWLSDTLAAMAADEQKLPDDPKTDSN